MKPEERPTNKWNFMIFLVTGYACIFLQSRLLFIRDLLGVQLDLIPAMVVYAATSFNMAAALSAAALLGLLYDTVSANPLGVTMLSLITITALIGRFRDLLQPESFTAQYFLGACGTMAATLLAIMILYLSGAQPLLGIGSLYQLLLMTGAGGLITPVWFKIFTRLDDALRYKEMPELSFRPDREIARGRH